MMIAPRALLTRYLGNEGYAMYKAKGAQEIHEEIRKQATDLIILDRLLPDGDGLTLAAEQCRINQDIAITMLIRKSDSIPIHLVVNRDKTTHGDSALD